MFGGSPSDVASVNHGTYFYHASLEGLLANDTNIHAGIRTTLSGPSDYENDGYCGFEIVEAREIDTIGTDGIIKKIKSRVGTTKPVYLSLDIDTLDPACEPYILLLFLHIRSSTLLFLPFNLLANLKISSCTGNWHSRDRRLVNARAAHNPTWTRGY